ncbi:hypothetical protein B0H14DRAFT_1115323 [Mycena olivaceomarginata]|nr:hypothetical protein B0H14DRAFT_1115323 [Mycena olivaceomarginata]
MCASSIFVESKNQMILEYETVLRREVNVLLVRPGVLKPGAHEEHEGCELTPGRTCACACLSFRREEEASPQHKSNKTETYQCSPHPSRLIWKEVRLTGWFRRFFSASTTFVAQWKGQSRPNEGQVAATAGSHPPFRAVCCDIWTGTDDLTCCY